MFKLVFWMMQGFESTLTGELFVSFALYIQREIQYKYRQLQTWKQLTQWSRRFEVILSACLLWGKPDDRQ